MMFNRSIILVIGELEFGIYLEFGAWDFLMLACPACRLVLAVARDGDI
jgi:hypothetical protein